MRELSQDEIDAVFLSRQGNSAAKLKSKALPFDFQRVDRIPKSQLRTIHFLHENLVRSLISSLSAYLRTYLSGHLVSVEQIPYSTFLDGLPGQTCMVSLDLMPYRDNAMLEINPSLIFPILELLLGGKETSGNTYNRDLTEMERYLLTNFFQLIARDLERTWRGVDDVEFKVDTLETKRTQNRTLGPMEAVVAIGMEFRIDDRAGMINLAMPSITIKTMVQKFNQQGPMSQAEPSEADQHRVLKLLNRAVVTVEPQLASRLTVRDLLALEKGSVVLLDHAASQPITGLANGKAKFEGEIVSDNGQMSFQIATVNMPEQAE
jgi:flagellar motor switch protein FliM